jgi:hypothetical protein
MRTIPPIYSHIQQKFGKLLLKLFITLPDMYKEHIYRAINKKDVNYRPQKI